MPSLHAQVPQVINYQGRVAVGGTNFTGTGLFKFALVNNNGVIWSSATGGSGSGEVSVPVSKGSYSVLLGDTTLANMAGFNTITDNGGDNNLYLRVWFNDGVTGSQQLSPDQRIGSVPFAFMAQDALGVKNGSAKLSLGDNFLNMTDSQSSVNMGGGSIQIDAFQKSGTNAHDIQIGSDGVVHVNDLSVAKKIRGSAYVEVDLHCQGQAYVGGSIYDTGDMHCLGIFSTQGATIGGAVYCPDLHASGSVNALNVYASNIAYSSDRNLKEKFVPTDSREVLKSVASLPISSWNFKGDSATRHIGPMAQDFYATFKVGTDEKHIGMVDEGGVALAAIQGLNALVEEKDAKIRDMERRLSEMEAKMERLTNPKAAPTK